jgi:hypothetical protein
LAENTYQSVSRGGLGLLSGFKIMTGMNLFLEMTARVAIAQVCLMNHADKVNLGIPAVSQSGQSSVAGSNWQAVGAFGIFETDISQLFEGRAYQGILEEIDGISGLIESEFYSKKMQEKNILSLLKTKQNQQQLIKELETKMYS